MIHGTFNSKNKEQVNSDPGTYVITFVESTTWKVPTNVTSVEVFAVGGGGGGGAGGGSEGGNGGNGGQVITQTVNVTAGQSIAITIGAGGNSNTNGTSTRFGSYVTALYGDYGKNDGTDNSVNSNQARGGTGYGSSGASANINGENGFVCPFDSSGKRYGAGGGGGIMSSMIGYGGIVGGGNSGFYCGNLFNHKNGYDSTFYGAGGGGGYPGTSGIIGGAGFQGIIKIRYIIP